MKKNITNMFQRGFFLYFVSSLLLEAVGIFLCKKTMYVFLHNLYMQYMANTDFNVYDVFYAQISTTFILISIISLLSTNTQKVYWDDMMHRKLIKPVFLNFTSLTAYLLTALIISTYLFFVGSNYILLSFLFSLILMSVFTVKMVGAYFGRESVKAEMEQEFYSLTEEEQANYRRMLMEGSMTAIDNNEMSVLVENMKLMLPVIANHEDDIDIYTNAVMNKIIVNRNTFALFCVLSQNDVLWVSMEAPFNQYFSKLGNWEGGFYYQKVLLDGYFNNSVMQSKMQDRTGGFYQLVYACFQVMYIEMSKEFGIENACQVIQMMKSWVNTLDKKGMIVKQKGQKPEAYIIGDGLAELLMDDKAEDGGLFILVEMLKEYSLRKNKQPGQVSLILFMYRHIVSTLQSDNSRKNKKKNGDKIMFVIQKELPDIELEFTC